MFQLQYFRGQRLTQGEDGATTELGEVYPFGNVFVYFVIGFYLPGIRQRDLFVLVYHFAVCHHHTITIDLEVALIRVDNHIEIFVTTEDFGQHIAETLLQYAHQRRAVDVFRVFELFERVDHAQDILILFSCYHSVLSYCLANREAWRSEPMKVLLHLLSAFRFFIFVSDCC